MNKYEEALEFMNLSSFTTFLEIKNRYKELSKEYHPDFGGDSQKMDKLNQSFKLLKDYIENYRFYFSDEEILKQYNGSEYAEQFRF